ncbi:hypothetical protein H0H93_009084, partial [Arthromyces matolae]
DRNAASSVHGETPLASTDEEAYTTSSQPRMVPEDEYYSRLLSESVGTELERDRQSTRTRHGVGGTFTRTKETLINTPRKNSVTTSIRSTTSTRVPTIRKLSLSHPHAAPVQLPSTEVNNPTVDASGNVNKTKNRGWRTLRHTISQLLHRNLTSKEIAALPTFETVKNPTSDTHFVSSPRRLRSHSQSQSATDSTTLKLKSSSASLYTGRSNSRRSAKRLTISPPPRVFYEHQAKASGTETDRARRQRVRRSRSFSGYPNLRALAAIADEHEGASDRDDASVLDEATVEAQRVMRDIVQKRRVAFAKVSGEE